MLVFGSVNKWQSQWAWVVQDRLQVWTDDRTQTDPDVRVSLCTGLDSSSGARAGLGTLRATAQGVQREVFSIGCLGHGYSTVRQVSRKLGKPASCEVSFCQTVT